RLGAVILADDTGRALHLLHLPAGGWVNRITDVRGTPGQQHVFRLSEDGSLDAGEWTKSAFNPLERPWHTGAMGLGEGRGLYWTDPYTFFSPEEPGMTASTRWRDPASGRTYVIGFDVRLLDLGRFMRTLTVGRNGRTVLLTGDGKVIAANSPVLRTDDD